MKSIPDAAYEKDEKDKIIIDQLDMIQLQNEIISDQEKFFTNHEVQ